MSAKPTTTPPAKPPAPACRDCRHSLGDGTVMECRRNSPRPSAQPVSWPLIMAADWCGDFTRRTP